MVPTRIVDISCKMSTAWRAAACFSSSLLSGAGGMIVDFLGFDS